MDRPLQWETVPKGTRSARCSGETCRRVIYWIERPRRGKPGTARVPVDCDVDGGSAPDSMSDGRGVNHFQMCIDAVDFS